MVETTNINPRARLFGVPIGQKAEITERIFLDDPGTLRFDIDIVAPDALTEPYRTTQRYTRVAKTVSLSVVIVLASTLHRKVLDTREAILDDVRE